jgi:2-methylisocitrate lyase-like PEP mutase family enzyme
MLRLGFHEGDDMTQTEKARVFAELHQGPKPFIIPNPWDAGSAKALAGLGFKALTTTSYGLAVSLGRRDGTRAVTRDEALANAKAIVDATDLPVAADLENGYGDTPEEVAETIRQAAHVGLVGASIEDATGADETAIYSLDRAVARIEAASRAAKALPFPFVLVARAENFLREHEDLEDTITRLQAYERAGADVLFAPFLPDADAIRKVCGAVSKPVNVVAAGPVVQMSLQELGELGVRRVSIGSGFFNVATRAFIAAARNVSETGRFDALAVPSVHA